MMTISAQAALTSKAAALPPYKSAPPPAPTPDPAAGGSSDFGQVAQDARAKLDAGIKTLGKKPDIYTTAGQWKGVFGGLDRRALYAVASNKDGLFSKEEQQNAEFLMHKQLEAAMGLDSPGWATGDHAAGFKAGVQFLDSVSEEEKGSLGWAMNRASTQQAYEIASREKGEEPENLDSEYPLVKLIKQAMQSAQGDPERDLSTGPVRTIEDLKRQPWARGFEAQLESAYLASVKQGSLVDRTV